MGNSKKISLARLLDMAQVPPPYRDEIREMVVIGTGQSEFTPEEARSLVSVIRKRLPELAAQRSKKRTATAATIQFKRQHRPFDYQHCPICRQTMVKAHLRDGREVRYCPHHRVALPVPVSE